MSGSAFAPMVGIGPGGRVDYGGDDARMVVRFYLRSRLNPYKSGIEGRPVYEPYDYVKIRHPGERDEIDVEVNDEHRQRWPRHWEAYQQKRKQTPQGTPIKLLFPNEPHIVDLCVDLNVETIEQLAELSEAGINRLGMDGRKYVAKAQAALDRMAATKEVSKLTRELEEAREETRLANEAMEQLQRRVDTLEARSRQLGDAPAEFVPKRRGRPPKEPEAEPSGEAWLRSAPEHVVE